MKHIYKILEGIKNFDANLFARLNSDESNSQVAASHSGFLKNLLRAGKTYSELIEMIEGAKGKIGSGKTEPITPELVTRGKKYLTELRSRMTDEMRKEIAADATEATGEEQTPESLGIEVKQPGHKDKGPIMSVIKMIVLTFIKFLRMRSGLSTESKRFANTPDISKCQDKLSNVMQLAYSHDVKVKGGTLSFDKHIDNVFNAVAPDSAPIIQVMSLLTLSQYRQAKGTPTKGDPAKEWGATIGHIQDTVKAQKELIALEVRATKHLTNAMSKAQTKAGDKDRTNAANSLKSYVNKKYGTKISFPKNTTHEGRVALILEPVEVLKDIARGTNSETLKATADTFKK